MIRKLLIAHWFGPLPDWALQWRESVGKLREHGYDVLLDTDLDAVKRRVWDRLGVEFPAVAGGAKMHDLRPLLGALYEREIDGYDFWGHTDLDCAYGRVDRFVTDDLLATCDAFTDCAYDYLAGPFTLYRADPMIAALYRQVDGWQSIVEDERVHGWVETSFTEVAKAAVTVRVEQYHRFTEPEALSADGDRLLWHGEEISYFHFNRSKRWPL